MAAVGASPVAGHVSAPRAGNALTIMKAQLAENPKAFAHKFAETDSCTVNLLAAKNEVPPHYHAKHEETVVLLSGHGVFTLAGGKHIVEAGDVFFIPRGTVHAFVPTSSDVVVVSTFTPKFDGKDRVFVGG